MRIQWIIAALFLTAACMTVPVLADAGAGQADQGMLIGMPDPSAVWAEQMGYGYATRVDDQGGQYGVIILPDGTERDAWEAYREYLAQQDESGQQSGPMIGMPGQTGYPDLIESIGYRHDLFTYRDGTGRDSLSAFRDGVLSRMHTGTAAADLLGGGQTSRQSFIASLLDK